MTSFFCSSPVNDAPFPSVTSVLKGLTSLNGCKEVLLTPTEDGVCMSVEVNKITQVHSYIPSNLFSVFRLNDGGIFINGSSGIASTSADSTPNNRDNTVKIALPLDSLYNALKFGLGSRSLFSLKYTDAEDNVTISYEGMSDKVECLIRTLIIPEMTVVDFNSAELLFKTILKSDDFSLYFSEILQKKSEWSIQGDPGVKQIILSYILDDSSTEIVIPIEGDDDLLDCRKPFKYSYTSCILPSLLIISGIATKVSIRINGDGLLSIQQMIKVNSRAQKFFVEFIQPSQLDSD